MTNRKSHMAFPLTPRSMIFRWPWMTLNCS